MQKLKNDYNFIVSDITESSLTLYCNCYYYGFDSVEYCLEYDDNHVEKAQISDNGEVTLKNLETGTILVNGFSKNGTRTTKMKIPFYRKKDSKDFLKNLGFRIDIENLSGKNYLEQLFNMYTKMDIDEEKEAFGQSLKQLVEKYNLLFQTFSANEVKPIFLLQNNVVNVYSRSETDYSFVIQEYKKNKWIEEENEYRVNDTVGRLKEHSLYRFVIMDNDNTVKILYLFSDSKKESDKVFNNIVKEKIENKNNEYAKIPGLEKYDNEDRLSTMFNIVPKVETILAPPDINYDDDNEKIKINNSSIKTFMDVNPDIKFVIVEDKNDFDGLYSKHVETFKEKVKDAVHEINLEETNIFDDGNYYAYYTDEDNNFLSIPTYFRKSEHYDETNQSYYDFILQKYQRALFKVFNLNYMKNNDWNICKKYLDRYWVSNEQENYDIEEYLIENLFREKNSLYSLDEVVYCIFKCGYDFFSDQLGSIGDGQVYKKRYRTHLTPKRDSYVKIVELKDGKMSKRYVDASLGTIETKLDTDGDYIVFQNIDKKTKRVSEPIMYNNTRKGIKTFFGQTQVIIDDEL